MPEKMPTYRIDEGLLRSKLLGYEVEMNPSRVEAIEQEIASLRFKKSINFPKINYKIAVPVALAAGLVTLVIFNLNSLTSLFSPAPVIKNAADQVSMPVKPAINTPVTQTPAANSLPSATVASTVPQPVPDAAITKVETEAEKKTDSAKQENTKKATPVMAQLPSDSVAKTVEAGKQDTSVQNTDQPVKKKKKRRRRNANIEALKESTLQSGNDDDVVVPQ